MRSKIKYVFIVLMLLVFTSRVSALSVSNNNLTLEEGKTETINLYVTVNKEVSSIDFTLVYSTYDITADFIVNSKYKDLYPDDINHSIILPEKETGKILLGTIRIKVKNEVNDKEGTISISKGIAKIDNENTITLDNVTIKVKVNTNEEVIPKEVDKNLLTKIDSELVTIDLQKDIFDYTITLSSDTKELDLKPIAKNEDSIVDISTQIIKDIKDNKITITVKDNDVTSTYTINLKIEEEKKVYIANTINIDNGEFKPNNNHKKKWIAVILLLIATLFIAIILGKETKHKKHRKKKRSI